MRALGEAVLEARIREQPEDYRVEELPAFEPSGEGEHWLLDIEKRGMNTGFAARRIAQWAGVSEQAIGYAGLKDRHAVTRQRFSVHLPRHVAPAMDTLQGSDLRVLEAHWHSRKLPRGALAGNRFVLLLRRVRGQAEAIEARLAEIAARGVPNAFGEQRFGRDGDNVDAALAMFDGRRVRREQRSLLLSAARSELFNRVLDERVRRNCWDRPMPGDIWMLAGSRSVFGPEPWNGTLAERLAAFDIHPTGPLWGLGEPRSQDDCRVLELAVLEDPVARALATGLEQAGLKQERRALRLRPGNMRWEWLGPDMLRLSFELPPGSYATTVLSELGDCVDPMRGAEAG
ncbi:MAG: tRNA pseudouridine(13) synthase TruD [Xanthomonadaceae bacterium]|jgi:tRNA pseudouridine13 synthase|nr:tRNA pseudouridine(13) synthase TruD [Xanthomonadaceae bacterium]